MSKSGIIIGFNNYRISCIIGIEPHEREKEQDLLVDLKVESVYVTAAQSDDIKDTVNYMALAQICKEIACRGRYQLLERYASDVLDAILEEFPVISAWINVKKPAALPGADCTFVEFRKHNDTGNKSQPMGF